MYFAMNMKWYDPIPWSNLVEKPLILPEAYLGDYDELSFMTGNPIDEWPADTRYYTIDPEDDGDPDDALQTIDCHNVPVFSSRLRAALMEASITGIQYLPVDIIDSRGRRYEGFSIANILNKREALDIDNAEFTRAGPDHYRQDKIGQILSIERAVLRRAPLQDVDIIRLQEYEQSIFVSERFKEIFEKNKYTGHRFREVEVTDT